MSFTQDTQSQVGPQAQNPTNVFDKAQAAPIPLILADLKLPEQPIEKMKKLKEFQHLPQIQQEFLSNLPASKLPF